LKYEGFVDCAEIKSRYGIAPMTPTILFVGRLAYQKGPDLLLEALPSVLSTRSDAMAVFVGDGHLRADLIRRSEELGIQHAVRFLGSMTGEPLKELFKVADCVCVPSRNEPFGIVVLEAWACAKPVVVSSSGGPGEFVRHMEDGVHVYPETGSIAWGLREVLSNFEHARRMGEAGQGRCRHDFTWDRVAEQTEGFYFEALQ